MKIARALVLVALGCALVAPLATASAAGTATLPNRATTTDTTGDVAYVRVIDDQVLPGGVAKNRAMGDIRTVQVTHAATVRVLIKYVELNRVGRDHFHVVQLRTPRRSYEVDLYATTGRWRGDPTLYTANGTSPRCTLAWKIDYTANTAVISVPRRCIGSPTWIRAGAGMSNTYGDKRYADDGLTYRSATSSLTLGPKLYR